MLEPLHTSVRKVNGIAWAGAQHEVAIQEVVSQGIFLLALRAKLATESRTNPSRGGLAQKATGSSHVRKLERLPKEGTS